MLKKRRNNCPWESDELRLQRPNPKRKYGHRKVPWRLKRYQTHLLLEFWSRGWNFKELLRNKLRFTWGGAELSMAYTGKYWTWWPDLSLLSVPIMNLYSDGKWKSKGRDAFFWPIAFSHLYDRTLGQIHIHRMTKISDSGKKRKNKSLDETRTPSNHVATLLLLVS